MEEPKKNILRKIGFEPEVSAVEAGLCPFCQKEVKDEDFRDELSRREFKISGLCQECQDGVFE